jgi:hypothetical protein
MKNFTRRIHLLNLLSALNFSRILVNSKPNLTLSTFTNASRSSIINTRINRGFQQSERIGYTSCVNYGKKEVIYYSQHDSKEASQSLRNMQPLNMALLPIPVEDLDEILTSRLPTPSQYASYWGRTSREQYNAFFEAFGVSFLGLFAAYFLSFAIGQFVATILGMIAGSWLLLGPELKAYQRNWELTSGREIVDPWTDDEDDYFDADQDKRGLYGAFYLGRIDHICVVDYPSDTVENEYSIHDFEGYTMEDDEQERDTGIPYSLRLRVTDSLEEDDDDDDGRGRELQIHTRMSEEYLSLEKGMSVCAVLLSTSQNFVDLAAITDFCVPDAGPCYVGDYPYLDRSALEQILINDEELWEDLRYEGRGAWDIRKQKIE